MTERLNSTPLVHNKKDHESTLSWWKKNGRTPDVEVLLKTGVEVELKDLKDFRVHTSI